MIQEVEEIRKRLEHAFATVSAFDEMCRRFDGLTIIPLGIPTKPLHRCCGWPDHVHWCPIGRRLPVPP